MPGLPRIPPERTAASPRHFTPAEHAQLEAIFEAIWPGSQTNPGAGDASAADYVDFLLAQADAVYYDIPKWRAQYAAGLPALDAAARSRNPPQALATLAPAEMTALLADLANGRVATFPDAAAQRDFLTTLRAHCIEGCLSDPRWGGNRDGIIWNWLGYPGGAARDFHRVT